MLKTLKNNSVYLSLSLMLLVALGLALLYLPKAELHLLLCDRHTYARDIFYRYYTRVGEWLPYVLCLCLLLFGRVGEGVFASSAMILSALSTQLIKHIVNAPRPVTWFAANMPDVQLPLVEGVQMNLWYSFPSGHTTSFFALAFVASVLITKNLTGVAGLLQAILFLLAALGAYSRIYLSQHFAMDVFAGILVGTLITLLCYAVFYCFEDRKWYNFRLFARK
jgi:membrane-associated phospholipid phosphatase